MHILKIEKYLLNIYKGYFSHAYHNSIPTHLNAIYHGHNIPRGTYRDCVVMSNCDMKTILISPWTPHYNDKL